MGKYYTQPPLAVDGDTAYAADINDISAAADSGFVQVDSDIEDIIALVDPKVELARKWAEEDEDVEVVAGEYSALHWAAKSSDSADASAISESNASTSETNSAASAIESSGYATNSAASAVESSGYADDSAASAIESSGYADDAAESAAQAASVAASKLIDDEIVDPDWAWSSEKVNSVIGKLKRSARTSDTTLISGDTGYLIDITSGTFAQTFDPVASLGDGWFIYIRNSGTGDITLDPDSSETIDGVTAYIMYPNEVRIVQCDGTTLRSIVLQGFNRTYTVSGSFVKPPGYHTYQGLMWSGGASGQRSNNNGVLAKGGAGGGCYPYTINPDDMATSESITIGSGGVGVTAAAGGNVGNESSIGTLRTVYEGPLYYQGGSAIEGAIGTAVAAAAGFEGHVGANTSTLDSSSAYGGAASSDDGGYDSGNSLFGGAGGGSTSAASTARAGGVSDNGGNGGDSGTTGNGEDGVAPGGGGGGTQTGTTSGAGARGEVRIWGIV